MNNAVHRKANKDVDEFAMLDEELMQMDFDGIASLAPLALNTNRSSNPCADEEVQSGPTFRPTLSASSRSVYEKLWDEAPRPGGPSMDLHRNVAYAQMVRS